MNKYLSLFFMLLAGLGAFEGLFNGDFNYVIVYSNLIIGLIYQILAKLHGEY